MDDYGRSKAGPSQFSSIGREKSAVAKWRRWNHRHKIRPIVFPESSGGMLFSTTYIFPDTSKYRDSFRTVLPPGQIFRHIRWAETNFKTFLLSSLQLKLPSAVTDPSPDSSHSSHEPRTFLSFFLFFFLTSSKKLLYREKHWLNRGAEGMDDNVYVERIPLNSYRCLV